MLLRPADDSAYHVGPWQKTAAGTVYRLVCAQRSNDHAFGAARPPARAAHSPQPPTAHSGIAALAALWPLCSAPPADGVCVTSERKRSASRREAGEQRDTPWTGAGRGLR